MSFDNCRKVLCTVQRLENSSAGQLKPRALLGALPSSLLLPPLAPLIVTIRIRNKIIHLQQVSRVAPFSRVPEGASNGELNKEEGSPGEEHPNTSDQTRQIAH